jgi:hypothetical protein
LTGFALSPDGQHVAVGGANGLTILGRAGVDAGGGYATIANAPLPVDCLTWAYAGLYACADEAIAGFTIGVSTDGGETFTPILHLKDLTPASCASASSAGSCAAQWCSTANAIGASCSSTMDAGAAGVDGHLSGTFARAETGCSCETAGGPSGIDFVLVLALMAERLRSRKAARRTFGG